LRDRYLHPDFGVNLTFVCENCLHLRQCLHPESVKKSTISLPSYYWSYFDLRHEFEHMYTTTECQNLNTMLESNYPITLEEKNISLDNRFLKYSKRSLYSTYNEI
jgi:hypothetical protein